MNSTALIGIDLGKQTFHLHCQDKNGKVLYREKMTRTKLLEFLNVTPCAHRRHGGLCRCTFHGAKNRSIRP
ncbi:transposase [Xenorhabdus sp. TS4]|uniref:Transposase n=1 Tax=Xenorhabdus ehlersii TaxID=290111 RepID=A0A2D0INZ9_9GAMM|nr:transposase [Xenorhabdus sp. TS4]PHM23466.1 transposase [Xenorhabdus ehlersii]